MKFGLFGINNGPCADPDVMLEVAQTAESLGFESVWTGEHVVLPDPQVPPSPAPPLLPFVHPPIALSFIAAATTTLMLGTGITLLSQRNALVLAKEIASLDYLSKGRLLFGIGAGYLEQEFNALGVSFKERGARADEYLDAMRELWTSDAPSFAGNFVNFSGIQSRPQPHRAGGPPVVVGGTSAAAYRRAVTRGQGWYGFALKLDQMEKVLAGLQEAASRYQRPPELGKLEISITPGAATSREDVGRWEELGVSRLILLQRGEDRASLLEYLQSVAQEHLS